MIAGQTYPVTDGIFKWEDVVFLSTFMDESEEGKKSLKYHCKRIPPYQSGLDNTFVNLQAYELQ